MLKLGVNIDHVATLREARYRGRGRGEPDPVPAALLCEAVGAHGITAHLREDRRHIQDRDVWELRRRIATRLNLEMANAPSIVEIALQLKPDIVCLVPERRQEVTTEGGLDVAGQEAALRETCARLRGADLQRATLAGADLAGADLAEALLQDADLTNTDLRGANLSRAVLDGTLVAGARLDGACLTGAVCRNVQLWQAGLDPEHARDCQVSLAALYEADPQPTQVRHLLDWTAVYGSDAERVALRRCLGERRWRPYRDELLRTMGAIDARLGPLSNASLSPATPGSKADGRSISQADNPEQAPGQSSLSWLRQWRDRQREDGD